VSSQWVSTDRGKHLVGRRKVNTSPEVELRRAVHAAGGRFRLHPQIAKGCTPDFVLPGRRLAVFVDGCFWHSCPEHGRKTPWTGPNADLWEEKMRRNAERDVRASRLAQAKGFAVVRIWECEIARDPHRLARKILGWPQRTAKSTKGTVDGTSLHQNASHVCVNNKEPREQ